MRISKPSPPIWAKRWAQRSARRMKDTHMVLDVPVAQIDAARAAMRDLRPS